MCRGGDNRFVTGAVGSARRPLYTIGAQCCPGGSPGSLEGGQHNVADAEVFDPGPREAEHDAL